MNVLITPKTLWLAIRREVGDDPVERQHLEALRKSFQKMLENITSPDNTVNDMKYRAHLTAAFDAVYQRIYAASRVK